MTFPADKLAETLRHALRSKMSCYRPEPAAMPFHSRLLGKDRMALFSFIHSLNTRFGASIFEPVAQVFAQNCFKSVGCQEIAGTHISSQAQETIQKIMNQLGTCATVPNQKKKPPRFAASVEKESSVRLN